MNSTLKRWAVLSAIFGAGLLVAVLALHRPEPVSASSGGRTGVSGNPATGGQTCSRCHSGGFDPVVTINGPDRVMPGATNTYSMTIAEGQRDLGGLNVSTTGGALGVPSGNVEVQIRSGEITHVAPKSANNMGVVIFEFLWTAPNAPGEVTLYGAGNSVNGDTRTSGDAATANTLMIAVGGDTPPTATPTITSPPTPLPTVESPYDLAVGDLSNPHGVTPLDNGMLLVGEGGTAGEGWMPGQFAPGAGDGRVLELPLAEPSKRSVLVENMTNSMDPGGGVVGGNHAIRVQLPGASTDTATVTLVAQAGGPGHLRPDEAAKILVVDAAGQVEIFADPLAYETANNPGGEDGPEGIDSNPWRLVAGPDDRVYVIDAGANDILALDLATREFSTWAVFAELSEGQQAIPTGLAFSHDDDGIAYVSLLGSFEPGMTQIQRLEDLNGDGDMLDEGEASLLVNGLWMLSDLAVGPGGHLFFSQILAGTLSRLDPACWSMDAACGEDDHSVVADQLPAISAVAFLDNGDALVTTTNQPNPAGPSLNPNRIVRIPAADLVPPVPTDPPTPEPTATPDAPAQPTIYLPFLADQVSTR